MLNIINNLGPFIEDCYKEFGVREYSRVMNISPPTASRLLKEFEAEKLVKKREERNFLLFRANRESLILKEFSRAYWMEKLKNFIEELNEKFYSPTIVLFGSLSKLEVKEDSDIDLAVFTKINKKIDFVKFEKALKRKIQLFVYQSFSEVKSKELKMNILNGCIFQGEIK